MADLYEINVDGTTRVVAAAARAGVRRAVVVSSNSPIGVSYSPKKIFDETSPYRPYMNYGRSKMIMELAVREFERRGLIETVIIRPPWFYGPNQPPRQTLFFKLIRDGKFPMVGDGNNLRSMSYIDNLVQGLLLAESVPAARGQTYWIADERPYSMNEIVGTVRTLLATSSREGREVDDAATMDRGRDRDRRGRGASNDGTLRAARSRPLGDEQDDRVLDRQGEARTRLPSRGVLRRRDAPKPKSSPARCALVLTVPQKEYACEEAREHNVKPHRKRGTSRPE